MLPPETFEFAIQAADEDEFATINSFYLLKSWRSLWTITQKLRNDCLAALGYAAGKHGLARL